MEKPINRDDVIVELNKCLLSHSDIEKGIRSDKISISN